MDISIQGLCDSFETIRGTKGTHYDLANMVRDIGLEVRADTENNELSQVILPGTCNIDGSDIVIGKIVGGHEAEIV